MQGTRLGPYRLGDELGSGGMGSVYVADVMDDVAVVGDAKRVAIKVIHPHLLEKPGFFKRFMREAEIGRSVKHEAVVKTLDVDALMVDGKMVNFMVMEYVEGRTLRDLLEDLKQVPETLLREIARQVTGGLQAIHAAGIVHRDLKPENVLITPDDEVKVMDLGVARLVEETVALTRDGQFTGSVLYAAPEQFEAAGVGPAADLYSMGVMLFELATGENPFQRDDAVACMKAHLSDAPPRLVDRNTECSLFLGEVVATLLEKDPAARPESAAALHALFTEAEQSAWWAEREQAILREVGHLPKVPVRRETRLLGREDDLAALVAAWEGARAGRGHMVLLEGEAGIGKSRLVDAVLERLKGVDAHVLYGAYPPSGGLGGLTESLEGKFGDRGMEEALAPYLTVTPRLLPAFAAMVRHEATPAGTEPLTQDAFQTVFVHLMKALAAEKPLLWVVEDLQFAAEDSRKIVIAMARALAEHRVLVLATSRSGLPEDEASHLSRLPHFERRSLARLSPREVILLLQEAFGSSALAEKLGGTIAYKSDGVPYFVFEIIRGLKEGSLIAQRPDGTWAETQAISSIEVPSTVRDLIEARLKDIVDEDRDLLDVAAVIGVAFDPRLVATVCEMRPMKVLQRFAALERGPGIVRAAGKGFQFDQNQIQEVLYTAIVEALREEYHAAVAEAYAEREGIDPSKPEAVPVDAAVFVATHHAKGSRPREGLPLLLPALDHLLDARRLEATLALAERVLVVEGLAESAQRFEVLERKYTALTNLGRPRELAEVLDEMESIAVELDSALLHARAESRRAAAAANTGAYERAKSHAEEALETARSLGDPRLEASAMIGLGNALTRLGRIAEGEGVMREAVERLAPGAGSAWIGALANLSAILGQRGMTEEASRILEEALEAAETAGDWRQKAIMTGGLGERRRERGDLGEARAKYEEALHLARGTGFRRTEAFNGFNLAETCLTLGDPDTAERLLDRARDVADEIDEGLILRYADRLRGDVRSRRGDPAGAAEHYRRARDAAQATSMPALEAEALIGLGRLALEQGRGDEARALLVDAGRHAVACRDANSMALSTAMVATLPESDRAAAAKTLDELEDRPWVQHRMEARWYLWKATGDAEHLEEAKRLLDHLVEYAPEEYRVSMIENVLLHKLIREATA